MNQQEPYVPQEEPKRTRSSRKKTARAPRPSNLGSWLRKLLAALALMLAVILGATLLFLGGLDSEGVASRSPKANENTNILIMGVDGGVLEDGGHMIGRSDVLMLMSLDTANGSAMLLSIPRDTRVELANIGEAKVNAAHVFGGPQMTITAVEDLIGQPVHYYVKMDFDGFKAIVDAAGGVTLDVEKEMHYYDPYAVPELIIDLQAGIQHLDGDKAEQYVRYRDETGDIGRVGQQKKLALALLQKFSNPLNLWRLPLTAQQAQQYIKTNMNPADIARCGWAYLTLREEPLAETLPGSGNYDGSFWLPDYYEISALFAKPQRETSQSGWFNFGNLFRRGPSKEEIRLIVLNGNGVAGTATHAASILQEEGYQVIEVGDADHYGYMGSVIVYNEDAEEMAKILQESLPDAELQQADWDNASCDLVVIVGSE